ncbi:MAG: glycogen debranching enzyme GlgX [Bdellovibrionota bacterium]
MPATQLRSSLPLGATYTREGTDFRVYAGSDVERAYLLLFDSPDNLRPTYEIAMQDSGEQPYGEDRGRIFRLGVEDIVRGQCYTYRFEGRWSPMAGSRTNPFKASLDPYAMAIGRRPSHHPAMFPHDYHSGDDLRMCDVTNFHCAPLAAVVDHSQFDWGDDKPLHIPLEDLVICEVHVKGLTRNHPTVRFPGSYTALASDEMIHHFHQTQTTAVQPLPVHAAYRPVNGSVDYWGYGPMAFLAPEPAHSAFRDPQDQVDELKLAGRRLRQAGIEFIIDVVFNHTSEGNELGPTLSLKGAGNGEYYRLSRSERGPGEYRGYYDLSGTGNTMNMEQPAPLQLVIDAMVMWVTVYRVDGFRFDLAWALRSLGSLDSLGTFFQTVAAHPILSKVKLIAEPWDTRSSGLGCFPSPWVEFNGEYRDQVRRFWRGDRGFAGQLSDALVGSQRRFPHRSRPYQSLGNITCHDGPPLPDLTAYEMKHNEENGEGNRDGNDCCWGRNYGVEGPTNDPVILAIRRRQCRNMLGTLFLSQGPLLTQALDWFLQSNEGNNNPWCQDNRRFWLKWRNRNVEFFSFWQGISALRRRFLAIARHKGKDAQLRWLCQTGAEMTRSDWEEELRKHLGLSFLSVEVDGKKMVGRAMLMILCSADEHHTVTYRFPALPEGAGTPVRILETHDDTDIFAEVPLTDGHYNLRPQSLVVIKVPLL